MNDGTPHGLRLGSMAMVGIAIAAWGWMIWQTGPKRSDGRFRSITSAVLAGPDDDLVHIESIFEVDLPDSAVSLTLNGDVLYASMSYGGLAVLDITEPTRPRLAHHLSGRIGKDNPKNRLFLEVKAEPERLIVMDRYKGYSVYDQSDPLRPKLQWSRFIGANPTKQAVSITRVGGYYYLACGAGGLYVLPVDFGPETQPVAVLDQFEYTRNSVFFDPHWLLVADAYTGLQVLDIRDPTAPRMVHQFHISVFCDELILIGSHVVMANRNHGFSIIDLQDPRQPLLTSHVYAQQGQPSVIKSMVLWRERFLLTGDMFRFINVYDLADPSAPVLLQVFQTSAEINAMALKGDLLYAGMWEQDKLAVYRLSL